MQRSYYSGVSNISAARLFNFESFPTYTQLWNTYTFLKNSLPTCFDERRLATGFHKCNFLKSFVKILTFQYLLRYSQARRLRFYHDY